VSGSNSNETRASLIENGAECALAAVAHIDNDFERITALLTAAAWTIACTVGTQGAASACASANNIVRGMVARYLEDAQQHTDEDAPSLRHMTCVGSA
jgi:hypothetical protein